MWIQIFTWHSYEVDDWLVSLSPKKNQGLGGSLVTALGVALGGAHVNSPWLDIQLPGFSRKWDSISPQKQGQHEKPAPNWELKIALIGEKITHTHTKKKTWGQKNYQPKESTIRLFFMGNPSNNYHTSLHSLIAPGCNLIPPGRSNRQTFKAPESPPRFFPG